MDLSERERKRNAKKKQSTNARKVKRQRDSGQFSRVKVVGLINSRKATGPRFMSSFPSAYLCCLQRGREAAGAAWKELAGDVKVKRKKYTLEKTYKTSSDVKTTKENIQGRRRVLR